MNDSIINGRHRPRGYDPAWNPHAKTNKLIEEVQAVLIEYRAHLPLTIRQVFYRLVGAHGYPKDEAAYDRLCYALGRARRAGLIGFDDLRDDGISVMASGGYIDEEHFWGDVGRMAEDYKRDRLADQDIKMRVLCEAAGMMHQLYRVCSQYSVPVYSCGGFDSLTAKYDLAQGIADAYTYEGKPTVVLHLGDYDPSGLSIYESMRDDVTAFVAEDVPQAHPEDVAIFERVALEEHQIEEFDLTTYPPKKSDNRAKEWIEAGRQTCQLEALPPDVLARILDGSIKTELDMDKLNEALEAEEQERRRISRALPSGE